MDRNQKLKALQAMLSGTPIDKAFPVIDLILIESDSDTQIIGDREGSLPNSQVNSFLSKLKADHPFKLVKVTRMTKEKYEAICEQLEKEY